MRHAPQGSGLAAAACGLAVVASSLAACDRGRAASVEPGDASPPDAPSATGAARMDGATDAEAEGGAARLPAFWRGTYKSSAATLYVPPDWKVRWRPEETPVGIGDGSLTLSIDPGSGEVRGAVEGPLGPAALHGLLADGAVSASIVRRDPHDLGFAGVLQGKVTADRLEGSMNLSLAAGGALRTATFSASPASPGEAPATK
jgi:hypothetical protein